MSRERKRIAGRGFYTLLSKLMLAVFVVFVAAGLYDCPTNAIFGIPCPGCDMTAAYSALFRLDFRAAFELHALFPIPAFFFVYYLVRDKYAFSRRVENALVAVSAILFFIRWIIILL